MLLDAADTLATVCASDGGPDREAFRARMGALVAEAASAGKGVVIFGEMVSLLWKQGRAGAAVQLEQLWNELAQEHAFSLYCAYSLADCVGLGDVEPFEAICAAHSRVIPAGHARETDSARQLAAIVESSDDAIISKGLDGRIRTWNAAAERLFGYSAAEAVGQSITLIVPPERLEEERHILGALARGERIDHIETTRRTKDGRTVEVSLSISPLRDASGRIIGASKVCRDITARRRAEAQLRESESALRQAHQELQARVSELTRFNQAAVGREQRITELKAEVNVLLEQRGIEPRYRLERGRGPPLPKTSAGFRDPSTVPPQGEPQVLLGYDNTPRDGAVPLEAILRTDRLRERPSRPPDHERETQALAALLRQLSEAPGTILQTLADTVLEILGVGSAGLSLLTQDGEGFYWAAIAGEWQPHVGGGTSRDFGPCGDVLDRDAPLLFSHWEHRYPYLSAATPLAEEGLLVPFHVAGRAVGTLWAIAHDSQRQFDAEDLRLLESLGRFASLAYQVIEYSGVIEQHHAALNLLEDAISARRQTEEANRKLKESEEALLEADRRKDEFLALLGHELRNPLVPIGNASELLSHLLARNDRAQIPICMIRRQAAQLTRLVDDLLDVGRITQGRIRLRREPLELGAVIAQAIETIEPQVREKRHQLSRSGYEPLHVRGDFARLVQCLANLLGNASKYTEAGGEIRIAARAVGPDAVIEVADNGNGIAPELLPRVFDIFVQGDCSLDRAQGGLGIGLAVVKRLVEMHGGQVEARSAGVGACSTFEIRLPRVAGPGEASRDAEPFKPAPQRVLIVDDNEDAATSLGLLLDLGGHETAVAFSGQQALTLVEAFRPEVALLDIGLPQMSGHMLAERLRAMPALDGLRLIALTGYGQPEDRERSRAAGFDAHLVKPVDLAALERALAASASRD